jgi:hypothetical protein
VPSLSGSVLVDGFAGATWKIAREDGRATVQVRPFSSLSSTEIDAVAGEGARLLKFAAADAPEHDVRFETPD